MATRFEYSGPVPTVKSRSSLHDRFSTRGILRGGVLLLEPEEAKAMIREAKKRRVNVLGVDAFFVAEQSTTPSMEFSRSFATKGGVSPANYRLAEEHIARHLDKGLLFEVVIEES